ncbi:hypothetical protein KSX_49250 [Ktedonospora formicarum]|uniref:Lipoprotein n=1 Tax=Ktedonospora formicarum TaxID=2778364 RepID=A0A8J3I625_9CHLR|nr:hypothetical protein KSX_49250 [Ktedonospora formicarum]
MRMHLTGRNWFNALFVAIVAILFVALTGCGIPPHARPGVAPSAPVSDSSMPLNQSRDKPSASASPTTDPSAPVKPSATGPRTICISLTREDLTGTSGQATQVEGEISGVDDATLTLSISGTQTVVTGSGPVKVTGSSPFGGKHTLKLTATVKGHVVGTALNQTDWSSGVRNCVTIKGDKIIGFEGRAHANVVNDAVEHVLLVRGEDREVRNTGGVDALTGDGKPLVAQDWHPVPANGYATETNVKVFGPPVDAGKDQGIVSTLIAQLDAGALVNN